VQNVEELEEVKEAKKVEDEELMEKTKEMMDPSVRTRKF